MDHRSIVSAGGLCFVIGALAFVSVFSYLAANFDYPGILDGSAAEVLPRLRAGGSTMRAIWAIYAFLPLLLVPGAVGAYFACPSSRGRMTLALVAASLGALAMCLGLMRWPSIHWHLAKHYATADAGQRSTLDAVFDGLNSYLGNYVGEFLGELSFSVFFLLSGWALLRSRIVPRWVAVVGLLTAVAGLVGMFRNLTPIVAGVAAVNNYLLPVWMIGLGIVLLRLRPRSSSAGR